MAVSLTFYVPIKVFLWPSLTFYLTITVFVVAINDITVCGHDGFGHHRPPHGHCGLWPSLSLPDILILLLPGYTNNTDALRRRNTHPVSHTIQFNSSVLALFTPAAREQTQTDLLYQLLNSTAVVRLNRLPDANPTTHKYSRQL